MTEREPWVWRSSTTYSRVVVIFFGALVTLAVFAVRLDDPTHGLFDLLVGIAFPAGFTAIILKKSVEWR
jgi:hypothetical protein